MDETDHETGAGETREGIVPRLATRVGSVCHQVPPRSLQLMFRLAERSNLLMTPFERNVQLWRQLWRVLERSHLIVQIVDARNPLGFRCADLEKYVQEIGDEGVGQDTTVPGKGKRRGLLLINKADLLTVEQRSMWADYFEKAGIRYAFFSAADAAAAQEQAEKQRRREEGTYEEDEEDIDEDEDIIDAEQVVDGEEVEPEANSEEELSKAVADAQIGDEEGWSTEGEHDEDLDEGQVEEKLAKGETVPLGEVSRQVSEGSRDQAESPRTRVLTVTELEDLFQSAAPNVAGEHTLSVSRYVLTADFATVRVPNPTTLVVGLVGYPNVGKSSTINALLGAKKVSVSSTPGKTKHFQTLNLSDEITLCDCPGLVFPQFANTQADMVVDGVLPIDQMREYSAPADLVCRRITRDILEGTYGIRIDVKEEEDGGTGKVTWEDLLSTYASESESCHSDPNLAHLSREGYDTSIVWYAGHIASGSIHLERLCQCQTPLCSSSTGHRRRRVHVYQQGTYHGSDQ